MFGIKEQLGMRIVYLRSSINKNYLSDLENGRRNPSLTIISRIAAALGVSLSELFKGLEDL